MRCEDFLEGYSNFVDGRLEPPEHATFEAHLESCESCVRYDRVVQRGLFIYRNLPELQPSSDFLPRLRHRLYHVDDAGRLSRATPVGSAALVAVAAVGFLALAWLPFATRLSVEVTLPPVAVEAPAGETELPSLFSRGPFITPAAGVTVPAAGWGVARSADWSFPAGYAAWSEPGGPLPALFQRSPPPPVPTASTAASTR